MQQKTKASKTKISAENLFAIKEKIQNHNWSQFKEEVIFQKYDFIESECFGKKTLRVFADWTTNGNHRDITFEVTDDGNLRVNFWSGHYTIKELEEITYLYQHITICVQDAIRKTEAGN